MQQGTAATAGSGRDGRIDKYGCSWVNLTDGSIHGEAHWADALRRTDDEAFHEKWARVVGYEARVASYAEYSYYLVEIVPLPWTGKWAVRFVVPQDGGHPERQYLGYPCDTHIKLFDSWEEARDRMRACGFSFARMSVVMPVHLAARVLGSNA
jgi:hypothetical protein